MVIPRNPLIPDNPKRFNFPYHSNMNDEFFFRSISDSASGSGANGLKFGWTTDCRREETDQPTCTVPNRTSSGLHCWRKLMPS